MLKMIRQAVTRKTTIKIKLAQLLIESDVPSTAKMAASSFLSAMSEEQVETLIIDFYKFLDKKDEIQGQIKNKFPELFTEV